MKKKLLYIVLICISLNTFASPKKILYDRILEKNDSFWISEKCLKILHTENKESIKKYFANIETLTFYHELEEKTIQWDEQDCFSTFCIIKDLYRDQDNLCVTWGKELDLLSFYMDEINYENGCFYINVVKTFNCKKNENKSPFSSWPIQEDECTIILRFDGDYLEVYLNNLTDYYDTFCKVDNETLNQYNNLIQTNKCDLSRVTWPRHADGSSDYGDSKKAHTPTKPAAISSTQTTNVAPSKTMTVKENLKLRSGEVTTTSVLAIMRVGTKVKILTLGKQATIDGITSNWVQVEVQAGAKDRDGKPIAAGTTGWCFGGYLTER